MKRQWAKLLAAGAVVLAGVGPVTAVTAAATAAANNQADSFAVRVATVDGTVTLTQRPTRILSLSPSATQMLYAIGAGSQVVGVDKYSTYPPGAPRTKFTGYETSAEDYLYLRPDLVIFAFPTNLVQQLKLLHIPSLVLPPATSMGGVYSQITELGTATGHAAKAEKVNSSLASYVAAAMRAVHGAGQGDTYYIEVDPTYYTATPRTFIGAEFSLFGMRDIANQAGDGYPQLQAEYILKSDPDYVFLADTVCCGQTAASFAHRPGFSALRAVKLHHVIGVNDSVASQWGPHTIELFVTLLAHTLRP
jgi:iron complex transport system substrate-binding protein